MVSQVHDFSFVFYRGDNRDRMARVWNGRRGEAPRTILLEGHSTAHLLRWEPVIPAPEHTPLVGEKIMVDLAEYGVLRYMDSEDSVTFDQVKPTRPQEADAFEAGYLYHLEREAEIHAPVVVTVTEPYAMERGWLGSRDGGSQEALGGHTEALVGP